jgi:anti-sigma B factor antagonist
VIIRQLDRVRGAAVMSSRTAEWRGVKDGGSDVAVMTAERILGLPRTEPRQLELSSRTDGDGSQVVAMTGELDIATAEQAYTYLSDVLEAWEAHPVPVTVDLSGLTFCDASGLGVLARIARHARQAGRQLTLTAARPSLLKIMRITGLDRSFPELARPAAAH